MDINYRVENLIRLGKALPVLMVVLIMNEVSEKEVAQYVGYSDKTCRKYLDELRIKGYITRNHRYNGWMPTLLGRQMVLPIEGKETKMIEKRGKNYRSNSCTNTTTIMEKNKNKEEVVIKTNEASGKNYRMSGKNFRSKNTGLYEILKDVGINGSVRNELAQRKELNEKIIKALERDLKERKQERYTVGLLIHCLREYREGDNIPEKPIKKEYKMIECNPEEKGICPYVSKSMLTKEPIGECEKCSRNGKK